MQTTPTSTDSQLIKFIKAFDYKLITISVQPETGLNTSVPKGKFFSNKNRVRAFPTNILSHEPFIQELQSCQEKGCAIYFTVNEGDGLPGDPDNNNFNCGKRANIKSIKALIIDTDNAKIEDLKVKLQEMKLIPHIIVESSPRKYHLYFLVDPVPTEDANNIMYWQSLQHLLDDLVPDLDQSMIDINQVLRLPGFYNLKPSLDTAFKIQVKTSSIGEIPIYDLKFLYDRLEAYKYNDLLKKEQPSLKDLLYSNGNGVHTNNGIGTLNGLNQSFKESYHAFEFPKEKLKAGERRTSITRYIEHLMENVLPLHAKKEDYFVLVDAYIIKYLLPQEAKDFLENGKRRNNIETYFEQQQQYRIAKHHKLESQISLKKFEHIEQVENKELPREFYTSFPGDLGLITNEILSHSLTLSPELAFSGALMISGALKGETFRYKGSWPLVNGLIIAGPGAGKSQLKRLVEDSLASVGMKGRYSQLIDFQNSVQSLHTSLYSAGGVGTTIVDESGDYLKMITSKNAPSYAMALKKYFKESTTGRGKGTRLSPGGSLSFTTPPIEGGLLSLWMMIQPGMFDNSLSLEDMEDGFLPRFFVFKGKTTISLTYGLNDDSPDIDYNFKPSMDMRVMMESLAMLMPFASNEAVKELTDRTEADYRALYPKAKADVIRMQQREAVYVARSEGRLMPENTVTVMLNDDAQALINTYLKEQEERAKKAFALNEYDPALMIYVRMQEMLTRLVCNAAGFNYNPNNSQPGKLGKTATVTKEIAAACIKFHKFQTDRFFSNELKDMEVSSQDKDAETVLNAIKVAVIKKGEAVTLTEVNRTIPSRRKPKGMTQHLKYLISVGQVWTQTRPHKSIEGRKVELYLPAVSEDPTEIA